MRDGLHGIVRGSSRYWRAGVLLAVACLAARVSSGAEAAVDQFRFDDPATLLSTADMERNGLLFPDGTLSFVRHEGPDPYQVYASGGSFGVGTWAHLPAGTYTFAGTLDSLHPVRGSDGPLPARTLRGGREQASPDGADFDRDYAGGGPTTVLAGESALCAHEGAASRAKNPRAPLLQIYHGEYHPFAPRGLPAYGGSGMALSCDDGNSFEKLGEILAPHVSRGDFLAAGAKGGLWADAMMVEADERAERPCGASACAGTERFFYLVFTDHNATNEGFTGIALARISARELFDAVRRRKAPEFRKYFNPNGDPPFAADHFTESGVGGRSTLVVWARGDHINTPGVMFDVYLKKFVMFYQSNQRRVELRTAANLLSWSAATIGYHIDAASPRHVYYPSAASGENTNPQLLGRTFNLYFLVRDQVDGRFGNPALMRQAVSIVP